MGIDCGYIPGYHGDKLYYQIFWDNYQEFRNCYDELFREKYGSFRPVIDDVVEKFLKCKKPKEGFAWVECGECGAAMLVPFTCQTSVCISCRQKKVIEWSDWLEKEVLLNVVHRHWVFTMPSCLWEHLEDLKIFSENRWLFDYLLRNAANLLSYYLKKYARPPSKAKENQNLNLRPGIIAVLQTSGGRLNFNPHVHFISTDGCIDDENNYYKSGFIPYKLIRKAWRNSVLNLLFNMKKIDKAKKDELMKRYENGFDVNGQIKDFRNSDPVKKNLTQYMVKSPIAENRIKFYNKEKKIVAFQYKDYNTKGERYRLRTETLSALEFIARVTQHIPDRGKKYVRYYEAYSNKVRGEWKKEGRRVNSIAKGLDRKEFRRSWRKLIWKVYGGDPLECPFCGGEMFITNIIYENAKEEFARLKIKRWRLGSYWLKERRKLPRAA